MTTEMRIWHQPFSDRTPFYWPITSVLEAKNYCGALLVYDRYIGNGLDKPIPTLQQLQEYQRLVKAKHGLRVLGMLIEYTKYLGETPCVSSQHFGLELKNPHDNSWKEWSHNEQTFQDMQASLVSPTWSPRDRHP